MKIASVTSILTLVAFSGTASADESDKDGVRFRGGVSLDAGGMLLANYSGFLAGVDGRLGVQLNHLIGIYAQPQLTFGPVKVGTASTAIGVFSGTGVVDFTLFDKLSLGAGGGFGVVNNPTGPVLQFRLAGYPLSGRGENGIRRKGLVLAADMRFFFLSGGGGGSATVFAPTGSIGYEAF